MFSKIRNFDDIRKLVDIFGPELLKKAAPIIVDLLLPLIPKTVQFKDDSLVKEHVTRLVIVAIDIAANIEGQAK